MTNSCSNPQQTKCYPLDFLKIILVLFLCVLFSTAISLPNISAELATKTQSICLQMISRPLKNSQVIEAYLCGKDLPEGDWKTIFIKTSLYHLIVVSGSHLVFLSMLLDRLKQRSSALRTVLTLLLVLGTGFQPPLVRALSEKVWQRINRFFRWRFRSAQTQVLGSFWGLSLFPLWISSPSFQLSLGACLGLRLSQFAVGPATGLQSLLKTSAVTYLLLLPLLMGWAQLHPLSILTNLFLAPALALLLWIFSGLWFIAGQTTSECLSFLLLGLQRIFAPLPLLVGSTTLLPLFRWIYLLAMVGALWGLEMKKARAL